MDRKQLLEKIIAREAGMFIAVKASEPADCQEMLKTFYLMREMSHSVLAADTLTSYLQDLETAAAAGRNLMTEKYARMENLIPSLNENELIYKIVDIEREWLAEVHKKYPLTIAVEGGFTTSARAGLTVILLWLVILWVIISSTPISPTAAVLKT